MPWLNPNENKSYQYRVYFGVFDVRTANNELLRLFQKDNRDNRNDFWSCYGCFSIDNAGIPIVETLTLSSLPWALGRVQSGEVSSVIKTSDWNKLFKSYSLLVSDKIKERANLFKINEILPDAENFKDLIFSLTKLSGWTNSAFEALAYCFVEEKRENFKNSEQENTPKQASDLSEEVVNEDEETKILNSFYVNDLQKAKNAFAQDDCGAAIKTFLDENEIDDAINSIWIIERFWKKFSLRKIPRSDAGLRMMKNISP